MLLIVIVGLFSADYLFSVIITKNSNNSLQTFLSGYQNNCINTTEYLLEYNNSHGARGAEGESYPRTAEPQR